MNIILAIVLGLLFGFILQKIGAANPQITINMLRLKDFHLMKAIFFWHRNQQFGIICFAQYRCCWCW